MTLAGEIFLGLLEQDSVWRTSDGRVLNITSMERTHRTSVLRMLERIAPDLYADWIDELRYGGDDDELLLERGVAEVDTDTWEYPDNEVRSWFERQPLVRRLRALERM